jgi:hypothetical protein
MAATVSVKLDTTVLAIAADSTFSFNVGNLTAGIHVIEIKFSNSTAVKTTIYTFTNTIADVPDVNLSVNITNVINLATPIIINAINARGGGTTPRYTFSKTRNFTTILQAEGASNVLNISPATLDIGDNWIYTKMKSNDICITSQSAIDSIKITRDQATGIIDPDNPGKVINIYPNPFNKQLNITGLITTKTYTIYVTNLNGQLLQQTRISNRTNAEFIVQREKPGAYLLNVYDEKKKVLIGSIKIIKQ